MKYSIDLSNSLYSSLYFSGRRRRRRRTSPLRRLLPGSLTWNMEGKQPWGVSVIWKPQQAWKERNVVFSIGLHVGGNRKRGKPLPNHEWVGKFQYLDQLDHWLPLNRLELSSEATGERGVGMDQPNPRFLYHSSFIFGHMGQVSSIISPKLLLRCLMKH